jgi:hypothetical protein
MAKSMGSDDQSVLAGLFQYVLSERLACKSSILHGDAMRPLMRPYTRRSWRTYSDRVRAPLQPEPKERVWSDHTLQSQRARARQRSIPFDC